MFLSIRAPVLFQTDGGILRAGADSYVNGGLTERKVKPQSNAKAERITFDELDRKMAMPILMQSLLVLTPVVSSTFASIGQMLADVPIDAGNTAAPFGLLVIDEAGQALPMAALGALARSRRAVIVGDPLQVEPVVPNDLDMLRQIWNDRLGREYVGKEASVQCIADARNPYGGHIPSDDDAYPTWLGCPLVVHRRCLSPMFDISNTVSYSETMLNETKPPSGDKRFCLPRSLWIDVTGKEAGDKNHYVKEQAEQALAIILKAFELREDPEQPPSLYVISPFTSVINGLRNRLGCFVEEHIPANDAAKEAWDAFVSAHIGTVHTFQGKEADEVIFLLGCDERARGAICWVSPNIVNVAASRAKYRLYVVGSADAWSKNPAVAKMKGLLEVRASSQLVL